MRPKCQTCLFWERGLTTITSGKWRDFSAGDCKRHAPIVTGGLHGPEQTLWPRTAEEDWCGDHTPKQEQTDE